MTMPPPIRKLTLTLHVAASVGWIGALSVFFLHALAGVLRDNSGLVQELGTA